MQEHKDTAPYNKTATDLLKEQHDATGLTQLDLATEAGITQPYPPQDIAGKRTSTLTSPEKLIKALSCKTGELIPDAAYPDIAPDIADEHCTHPLGMVKSPRLGIWSYWLVSDYCNSERKSNTCWPLLAHLRTQHDQDIQHPDPPAHQTESAPPDPALTRLRA